MKEYAEYPDYQHKRRIFTLIELLIVVAIIAILAGLLLPSLNQARKFAKQSSCFNNFRQILYGTVNYQDDSKDFVCNGDIRGTLFNNTVGQYWKDRIGYYISGNPKGSFSSGKIKVFDCPAEPKPEDFPYRCYGINGTFTGKKWEEGGFMRKTSAVNNPSELLHIAEAGGNAYSIESANWWYFRHGAVYMKNPGNLNYGSSAVTIVMYFDGHVTTMNQLQSRKVDFWAGYIDSRVSF